MKRSQLFSLMVATSALAASDTPTGPAGQSTMMGASGSPQAPAARPRLTDDLRHRVEEAKPAAAKEAAPPTSSEGVVMMAPVQVTGTYQPPLPRLEEQTPKNQPFTWKDGGTILKREGPRFTTELKFQYNAVHRGWDLLSFSW